MLPSVCVRGNTHGYLRALMLFNPLYKLQDLAGHRAKSFDHLPLWCDDAGRNGLFMDIQPAAPLMNTLHFDIPLLRRLIAAGAAIVE